MFTEVNKPREKITPITLGRKHCGVVGNGLVWLWGHRGRSEKLYRSDCAGVPPHWCGITLRGAIGKLRRKRGWRVKWRGGVSDGLHERAPAVGSFSRID